MTTFDKRPKGGGLSDRAFVVILGVVTAVWAANVLAGMFGVNGYRPSESVNGIFLAVVGSAVALRSKNKDGE